MQTVSLQMERVSFISTKSFEEILEKLSAAIGHPDIHAFHNAISAAKTMFEIETVVNNAIGSSELMEFARFDAGEIVNKENNQHRYKLLRLIVGNPVIMKDMAKTVPDAAAYAPITILVSERADGVHLVYDTMASLLAPYKNESATKVANALDVKVKTLLRTVAEC